MWIKTIKKRLKLTFYHSSQVQNAVATMRASKVCDGFRPFIKV